MQSPKSHLRIELCDILQIPHNSSEQILIAKKREWLLRNHSDKLVNPSEEERFVAKEQFIYLHDCFKRYNALNEPPKPTRTDWLFFLNQVVAFILICILMLTTLVMSVSTLMLSILTLNFQAMLQPPFLLVLANLAVGYIKYIPETASRYLMVPIFLLATSLMLEPMGLIFSFNFLVLSWLSSIAIQHVGEYFNLHNELDQVFTQEYFLELFGVKAESTSNPANPFQHCNPNSLAAKLEKKKPLSLMYTPYWHAQNRQATMFFQNSQTPSDTYSAQPEGQTLRTPRRN